MSKKKYVTPQTKIVQINANDILAGPLDLGSVHKDPGDLGGENCEHPVDAKENKLQYDAWITWDD